MALYLFDLDGTLRQTRSGELYIKNPSDQIPIPGVVEVLDWVVRQGGTCVGVTNQGGVDAGHKTLSSCVAEQLYTLQMFPQLSSVYLCPDYKGVLCWQVLRTVQVVDIHDKFLDQVGEFRKPNPGMLEVAMLKHWSGEPQRDQTWMIGDRPEDQNAAIAANVKFIHAKNLSSLKND